MRIAAVGDIHCTTDSRGALRDLFADATAHADVLALCGDLTDRGLPDEAWVLAGELTVATTPVVAVLGNHDFEAGAAAEVAGILAGARISVLDGTAVELDGVG
ncbi:MAG: metallophosphoesterase, partial [Chloroflexota bacterium]|nr:metallophosphoesterase [Chloroflexota bacterium]